MITSVARASRLAPVVLAMAMTLPAGCRTHEHEGDTMKQRVWAQLMFEGNAEEAMNFYVSTIPDSRVVSVERYGPGETAPEGSIKQAVFSLMGQQVRCIDSSVEHDFTFTPSMSLFVECQSEQEIDALAGKLAEGGQVFMPLDSYGFSRRFTFIADRYGVSWQLILPNE